MLLPHFIYAVALLPCRLIYSFPKAKGSGVHHNAPYLVRLKVTMEGVSVGIDEARRGVSENGVEANTIALFAGA